MRDDRSGHLTAEIIARRVKSPIPDAEHGLMGITAFWLFFALPVAGLVYFDARKHDWTRSGISRTAGGWAFGCVLMPILAVVYVFSSQRAPLLTETAAGTPIVSPDSKTCPDCAEAVRTAARRCRYCRYDFESG